MLLQDFNYFFNKAINQYINKRYNIYDVNQQTSDDLRVLKATSILDPKIITDTAPFNAYASLGAGQSKLFGATYEVDLPQDYFHILNCICIYELEKNHKCYDKGDVVQFAAKRLTADAWSIIVNDYYNRPLPERPYFYIHNVNINTTIPTNPRVGDSGTDMATTYDVTTSSSSIAGTGDSNFNRTIILGNPYNKEVSTIERETAVRYGNASNVRMEIRYGCDNSVFKLKKVLVDYIKSPQTIRLTQEQVNLTEDTSQIMEFPDYVCQEIINELTMLVMESTADPRLQSNLTVTQSIANPAQQQAPQPQAQQAQAQ